MTQIKSKTKVSTKPKIKALKQGILSSSANGKIEGKKYHYMHSSDCYVYVTYCENCKKEVGGWTPDEADKRWLEHCC